MRTRYQVPSFITTLALLTGLMGAAELITNGFPINSFPEWYNFLGGGYVAGIPFPAIIFLLVFTFVHVLMNFTAFGRSVYAVGGNAEAARLSGINVKFVKMAVLGFTAMLAALSGILQSAEIMAGTATTAKGWELDVIAAVIIGGTSLLGGSGRVWGTMVGIVFLGIIINGMTLLNISEYWQHVVRGVLILAAVLLNRMQAGRD
jgi:ribose/xylose/arabinose/galactoside ABC-type transport system permease subunit